MKTSDFNYNLPPELIAQHPIEPRDSSRLMIVNRQTGIIEHRHFYDIVNYLRKGDVLVFNESRVIPARLKGRKAGGGGAVEILLLRRTNDNSWEALVKPARRLPVGSTVEITGNSASGASGLTAEIREVRDDGVRLVSFSEEALLYKLGEIPLPPYIHAHLEDPERYQTVYARAAGSAAAPTAGLHFTQGLLDDIRQLGAKCLFVTLHIGLDTFRPVKEDDPQNHIIHKEFAILDAKVADELSRAKAEGRRVICVGTTSTRTVEHAAQVSGAQIQPFEGWASLYILPGHRFQMTDALITNFHLPESTLLMLVTAFAGKELIDKCYQEAIREKYRFYSFGDAMFII
jgi:S-adenosylmethionine:tRNA ribosyltransferase-isomerase